MFQISVWDLPETMRKLCNQEIRWDYGILCNDPIEWPNELELYTIEGSDVEKKAVKVTFKAAILPIST